MKKEICLISGFELVDKDSLKKTLIEKDIIHHFNIVPLYTSASTCSATGDGDLLRTVSKDSFLEMGVRNEFLFSWCGEDELWGVTNQSICQVWKIGKIPIVEISPFSVNKIISKDILNECLVKTIFLAELSLNDLTAKWLRKNETLNMIRFRMEYIQKVNKIIDQYDKVVISIDDMAKYLSDNQTMLESFNVSRFRVDLEFLLHSMEHVMDTTDDLRKYFHIK